MRLCVATFILLVVGGSLGACASYTEETREIRSLYRSDSYGAALEKLEASALKDEDRNRLLYRLEKAMILDRLGEADKSRRLLIEADKLADELYTVSVSRTAASFIVNEGATDYSGEDYEKVAIHTQLALSFIGQRNYESARVEAKKINNKLAEINQQYETNKNRYAEDAFARYLSGIIYETRGELDDALIDYAKALELYEGSYAVFVQGGVPDELVKSYWRLLQRRSRSDRMAALEKGYPKLVQQAKAEQQAVLEMGEVVVVHEVGSIAVKSAEEFVVPFGRQVVRFSFPVIRSGGRSYSGQTGFTDDKTGKYVGGSNVQDMDAIARLSLDDRRGRLIVKQGARLLAKGQLTEQAYQNFGPLGGIAANVYSAVSETADTRSWSLLPEGYYVTRAFVPVGKRTIKIHTGGRVSDIRDVLVEKGKIVILRGVD